jgi:hypothetical protein
MVTPGLARYRITPFWDDEYQHLDYFQETFNDSQALERWQRLGFTSRFTGDLCDMRQAQPMWNRRFIEIFSQRGWNNIGTAYYRMMPGTVLPAHRDTYHRYAEIFDLQNKKHCIRRAVIFLESWQSGHYFEGDNIPVTGWQAGDVCEWQYDLEHMAANLGTTPRYTLQITGHV